MSDYAQCEINFLWEPDDTTPDSTQTVTVCKFDPEGNLNGRQ